MTLPRSRRRRALAVRVRRWTSATLPTLLISITLAAQQAPQQTPVFRGGITIVPLTVTVLDKNGKPVTDLKQSDFTVLEDGVAQQIKTFSAEELKAGEAPSEDSAVTLARPAPFSDAAPATRRAFLLVLGYGHVQATAKAADGALEFIRGRLLPQDLVAVVAFNRATTFSANHELVAAAVERFKDTHVGIVERIDVTIDATRLTFAQNGDRRVAALDFKAFCGDDRGAVVGEIDDTLDINLADGEYQRVLKSGFRTTVRVPVTGDAKYVKVLVYDFRADLLGTAAVKLK